MRLSRAMANVPPVRTQFSPLAALMWQELAGHIQANRSAKADAATGDSALSPAVLAGCQAREMRPAPMLPEIRPSATVLPGLLVRGTTNVLTRAYFMRGSVP